MKGLESVLGRSLPFPLRAQKPERMCRVGVLLFSDHDAETAAYIAAFVSQLEKLGWMTSKNLQIDYRSTGGVDGRIAQCAAELVASAPDVILAVGNAHVGPLQQIAPTIPIVFVQVVDPLGSGFVKSLASPGGHATGFTNFSESDLSVKRLELLKQIAPHTTRTAVLRDPKTSYAPNWPVPLALARSFGLVVTPLYLGLDLGSGHAGHIEDSVAEFAEKPHGSLLILATSFATAHRELIISLARRYQLPAIYPSRCFVSDGGLVSYGTDALDQYRCAAGYVDYIFKHKKLGHLPVQQSKKVALTINLKTAKALGLEIPPTLLASAEAIQ
jgi:putative tryptophan/tyrosine transport system substrate-binding protein